MNKESSCSCQPKKKNVGNKERAFSVLSGIGVLSKSLFVKRKSRLGRIVGLAGGVALLRRGITGYCDLYEATGFSTTTEGRKKSSGINIHHTIEINRKKEELYAFWRELGNIPRFMRHIKNVKVLDEKLSEWSIDSKAGIPVTWKAEITAEKTGEYIAWKSLPDSEIETVGSVQFKDSLAGATEVTLHVRYHPPLGRLGKMLYTIVGSSPESQVRNDLRRFKQLMETGEIASTEGQSSGSRPRLNLTKTIEERASI